MERKQKLELKLTNKLMNKEETKCLDGIIALKQE